jgi:hypothetical protein
MPPMKKAHEWIIHEFEVIQIKWPMGDWEGPIIINHGLSTMHSK